MICNNRGNDRSKLTAQLATYPFGGAFLTSQKGSSPNWAHAYEYDRNTKETSAVDRLFSGRVLCCGNASLPLESINKRYWPRPKGEHQKQPSKAIKSSKRERERERANNPKG